MSDYKPPQSANEVLIRYRDGERYFGHSNLDEDACDFRGVNLEEVDFSQSFIVADFRDANLRLANFTQCNIKTCDFRGANLQNAIFRGALLESTDFTRSVLMGADFESASIYSHIMQAGEQPNGKEQ